MRKFPSPTQLLLVVILGLLILQPTIAQGPQAEIVNHVFATRVIQDQDGGFYAQEMIIGFQPGAASFHTLTQVIVDEGTHQFSMKLFDPRGNEIKGMQLQPVRAQRSNWVEALWVEWSDVRFNQSGKHRLTIYQNGQAVADFYLVVS